MYARAILSLWSTFLDRDQVDFRTPDGKTIKRLDGVKQVLGDFISRRQGDRVALILFGSKFYIQVPFTQELQTARTLLDQTEVGMAGQQTVIGDSIGLAIKTFETSKAQQKLVILLTDGNDTASRVPPEHAADIARQNGIVIYTVGFGDPNATGENRVDLGILRQVASATQGQFFRAEDGAELQARPACSCKAANADLASANAAVPMAARCHRYSRPRALVSTVDREHFPLEACGTCLTLCSSTFIFCGRFG